MVGMDGHNPYVSPAMPSPVRKRRHSVWTAAVPSAILCLATAISGATFLWAAWYRFDNTDAFGITLPPPRIPLDVVDFVILLSFATGCILAVLAAFTTWQAIERYRDWEFDREWQARRR